jgi:hypothetical protein
LQTINQTIDFIGKVEAQIPAEFRSEFQNDPAYQDIFLKHKKIDALTVITAKFPQDRGNAGDFSEDTIDYRIRSGYEDAMQQDIGTPHTV